MKQTGFEAITKTTEDLWNKVNEKYGDLTYVLCVNGIGEVILCKGFTHEVAKGNRNIQKALRGLLARQ